MGRRLIHFAAGATTGLLAAAAWHIYDARPRERIAGPEGLDSPEVVAGYDRVSAMPQMRALRAYVAHRALTLASAGHAVDLGCGPGRLVVELAGLAPGLVLTGVDVAPQMLERGAALAEAAGVSDRVTFREGNGEAAPLPDASCDLVISTLSLHHWDDPVAVLNEIARILRPGGSYLVFDLRRNVSLLPYLLLWFANRVVVPTAIRRIGEPLGSRHAAYTPAEIAALARSSHLEGWRVTVGPLWLTLEGTMHVTAPVRRAE